MADTTILLTRHGDRVPTSEDLSAAGRARALALVEAVAEFDIVAVYSPDKKRNYAALGGTGDPPEFYGDLYIMTLNDESQPKVEIRHYGK